MIKMWQHPLLLLGHGKFHYKSAILMFLLCICVCFLSSCGNVKENTESQVSEAKKFKNYASDIWSASGNKITFGNKIIYSIPDLDKNSNETPDLYTVTKDLVYVAYFSADNKISVICCTNSGKIEKLSSLSYESYGGPNAVYISFTDARHGYLLYCSDPGAGIMGKMLWTTKDSGHTYTPVKDLSTDIQNYPADMAFRNKSNGMILTSYHGEDTYAYITNDAGKTWTPYEIDNLKGSNYVNGVSIQKDDKRNIWVLTLQIATNHGLKTVIYTSNDLWKSWSKVQNSVQKAT